MIKSIFISELFVSFFKKFLSLVYQRRYIHNICHFTDISHDLIEDIYHKNSFTQTEYCSKSLIDPRDHRYLVYAHQSASDTSAQFYKHTDKNERDNNYNSCTVRLIFKGGIEQ